MLILARKPGESIVLDGGIRIVVVASDRGGVRLGIEAPAHVTVLRGELAAAVADSNRGATATAAADWVARLRTPNAPGASDAR